MGKSTRYTAATVALQDVPGPARAGGWGEGCGKG